MNNENKLGICMDHHTAKLIIYSSTNMKSETIVSFFTAEMKQESLSRSEHVMNNKEQNFQQEYYREIAQIIKQYTEIILFGPTNAKIELFNILKSDSHFDGIKINVESSDNLTEPQELAFVRDYFTKHS